MHHPWPLEELIHHPTSSGRPGPGRLRRLALSFCDHTVTLLAGVHVEDCCNGVGQAGSLFERHPSNKDGQDIHCNTPLSKEVITRVQDVHQTWLRQGECHCRGVPLASRKIICWQGWLSTSLSSPGIPVFPGNLPPEQNIAHNILLR